MASRSQPRRPCAVASSGGSSSPRRSPNCSSSAASTASASARISRGDLLVVARRVLRRVRVHLRAVDRDHPNADQPGLRAERQHLAEQVGQRRLVALAEARDRRVIGPLVRADHAERDVLHAAPLDPPRRALARSRRRRATAPPSSPDRAPPDHARPRDRPHRTRPDRSPRPRRSQTTRGDPPAATRAGSAATTAPARDHTPGSSAASRHRLNRAGQTRPFVRQPPWKATVLALGSRGRAEDRRAGSGGRTAPRCAGWWRIRTIETPEVTHLSYRIATTYRSAA